MVWCVRVWLWLSFQLKLNPNRMQQQHIGRATTSRDSVLHHFEKWCIGGFEVTVSFFSFSLFDGRFSEFSVLNWLVFHTQTKLVILSYSCHLRRYRIAGVYVVVNSATLSKSIHHSSLTPFSLRLQPIYSHDLSLWKSNIFKMVHRFTVGRTFSINRNFRIKFIKHPSSQKQLFRLIQP